MPMTKKLCIPCIYAITNIVNGKRYIGSALDFRSRCYTHTSQLQRRVHGNRHLQRAYDKYGIGAFRFSIVCVVEDPLQLLDCEQAWIEGFGPEYNIYPQARSCMGVTRTPETRNRLRLAKLGKKASPETKLKMSMSHQGKKFTPQWRANIALAKTGYVTPVETRLKISASKLGKTLSQKHIASQRAGWARRKLKLERTTSCKT